MSAPPFDVAIRHLEAAQGSLVQVKASVALGQDAAEEVEDLEYALVWAIKRMRTLNSSLAAAETLRPTKPTLEDVEEWMDRR